MNYFVWYACISFTWKSPEGLCAFILYYTMAAAMAAAPARREKMPLHFLRLFVFFSSLLAHALPTIGSVQTVRTAIQLAQRAGSAGQ